MIHTTDKPRQKPCQYCRSTDPPMISPANKKRFVVLTCACCGNQIGVRYVPKNKKGAKP